jgi:hypothetical protein
MSVVPEDETKSFVSHAGTGDAKSFVSGAHTADDDPDGIDVEVQDIRRRREEVSARYDARLEYLRAKLKGAQLHEKLMKK